MYPAGLRGYFSHEGPLSLVITDDASLGLGRRAGGRNVWSVVAEETVSNRFEACAQKLMAM